MTILDAELLDSLFSKPETIGLPWTTIWAFLRVVTNPRLFPQPVDAEQAFRIIRSWLSVPGVVIVEPGVRHAELLEQVVTKGRAIGPLVRDAVLAALAIEQGQLSPLPAATSSLLTTRNSKQPSDSARPAPP